jgi:hypothetical protein
MHSSQCKVLFLLYKYLQLPVLTSIKPSPYSLKQKISSYMDVFFSPLFPTPPPAIISHSALASSPHFSLVCGIAQGGGTLVFFFLFVFFSWELILYNTFPR